MGSEIITEAVHIDGPIKIVITPRSNLTRYVRSRHGARFFVVTNSRIQQYKSDHGRWVVTDWNPDVNP
jgi:hypothetical protein